MLVFDDEYYMERGEYLSFNPCFSGCWSSTTYTIDVYGQVFEVSILVLVDVGLRHIKPVPFSTKSGVSILVLVDVGLRLS